MMLPRNLPAIRSNERAKVYHSDVPHSEPIGSSEHLGLTSSENPFGSNESRAPLEQSSNERFRLHGEADELWNDVKAERGYPFYADNLKAYIAKHEGRDMLLGHLSGDSPSNERKPPCTIFDLFKDGSSRLRVVERFEDNVDSTTKLVKSLRQPPAEITVQILLWNCRDWLYPGTVNALGSALKLYPLWELSVVREGHNLILNTSGWEDLSLL